MAWAGFLGWIYPDYLEYSGERRSFSWSRRALQDMDQLSLVFLLVKSSSFRLSAGVFTSCKPSDASYTPTASRLMSAAHLQRDTTAIRSEFPLALDLGAAAAWLHCFSTSIAGRREDGPSPQWQTLSTASLSVIRIAQPARRDTEGGGWRYCSHSPFRSSAAHHVPSERYPISPCSQKATRKKSA
ncbi:hypothetical protein K402DRAFT_395550 [Aulographum hederae CBS 113979]|uniref:Uncharacterized protein n=1 Tax=Aulographum hederae CBS 113979 TaxID=1176131 RepID=A0A6G1GUA1_9PEZI|nr:hypothetical protein K402DRAFT_395550 [Aulographum hederae CBS 113979]